MSRGAPLRHVTGMTSLSLGRVLVCVCDAGVRDRIRDALKDRANVECHKTFADLLASYRAKSRPYAVVVEPYDAADVSAVALVRTLRHYVGTPIVACCRAGAEQSKEIRVLALAGVHEFLFRGIDDYGITLRSVLESATQACAADV